MIPRSDLAQAIGQSVLRCVEKYEKETGKRASKVLIELIDTDEWQMRDSAAPLDDKRGFSIAGVPTTSFGFRVKIDSAPESI